MTSLEFDKKPGIDVYRGVDWVADVMKNAPAEREMTYKYAHIKPHKAREAVLAMAELMRAHFPRLTPSMLDGRRHSGIIIKAAGKFTITTPPRPYKQWIYDAQNQI